ncbi:MAG: hypothetical protein J7M25_11555 [Deltaproteobacteria bacterium]|nr:hypothetical protein [Deltaproteobacteria bacterium]
MGDTDKGKNRLTTSLGSILVILVLAGMAMSKYTFDGPGFGETWPTLFVAVGLVLLLARYYELGLSFVGVFGVVLLGTLGTMSLKRGWPFTLVVIAIAAGIGYLRSRSGQAPGPKSTIRPD